MASLCNESDHNSNCINAPQKRRIDLKLRKLGEEIASLPESVRNEYRVLEKVIILQLVTETFV